MTKDRDFKKLVRARMKRTGESYSAARAQLATDENTASCIHAETAGLVRLLAAAGVKAPGGGQPSEALALGLGGGIGAACFVFDYKGHAATFYVATRCQPQYAYDATFIRTAAARFGARCTVAESTSPAVAIKKLRELVASGPVMAWLDLGMLPWSQHVGPAAELGSMPHVVLVSALDGDMATIHDTPATPFTLTLAELAAARKRFRNGKHRLLTVAPSAPADPRVAIRDSIAACAAELRGKTKIKGPMSKNFGVEGLRRWAAALESTKDPKRFTKLFPPKQAANVLAWGRFWIEHAGTGGGGFRPLYAKFLDEAASIVNQPALRGLATRYRELGAEWSALATAMLPAPVPALAAIRRTQDKRSAAFERGDLAAMRDAETELARALAAAAEKPPFDEDSLRGHYTDLAARVTAIADAEDIAATALADAAG